MQVNLLYRPSQSLAQCWLQNGESVVAESGAMVGMSTNVQMQTQSGGLMKGLKRLFGGESFFRNTFTAQGGQGEVLFATPLCGDMAVLEAGHKQWCIQNSAYVASSPSVDVKTKSGGFKGMFSGAGLFTLETSGMGQVIIGTFGALEQVQVDGSMVIDTGHLAAWESTLQYKVGKSGAGWIASFLSGEGLVCHFEGQGTVYLQSRNAAEYGSAIGALLPPREQ
ncbi:TIGR00266 family protein [Polyangium jinanense]|uniref:TIGR00266 family protein n=1 Tax=Polyangium jinanense TaxID=2829994 RepID=A0A9X3X265_9BACT|nr:TIGR00266 family protein [Polyangium jinanense]MDC3955620.1 TIGR00266 family protein [Polyangium jinanense]MDC3982262.1 TIGR00266 family protein [Polyangium jinanense]